MSEEKFYKAMFSTTSWPKNLTENKAALEKTAPLRADPDAPLFTFPEELGEPRMDGIKWARLLAALAVCSAVIGIAYVMI